MSEIKRTGTLAGAAVVITLLAFLFVPSQVSPDDFSDLGESLFPNFNDPNKATTLEVIEYSEETGSANPFKVTFKNGLWTIPSHNDYPADGKDRLAKTAAGVIEIQKDDFRSSNKSDQEACGVIDPLDETNPSLSGRGKRITIKGASEEVLADLILGKELAGQPGFRFLRLPDSNRIYASKVDLELSTNFQDWIERDLIQVEKEKIVGVTIRDYSIDERTGRVNQRDTLEMNKDGGTWIANRMRSNQEVNSTKMNELLGALDGLSIVGVRPKPEGLSASLRKAEGIQLNNAVLSSLQSRGYYVARDGRLLSNEGELQVESEDGILYTLRFGEVVYGTGDVVSAGSEEEDSPDQQGPGENRYLFITTEFQADKHPEPAQPANQDYVTKNPDEWTDQDKENKDLADKHQAWQQTVNAAKEKNDNLNVRFSDWYYVISADSFSKLDLGRSDLVKNKDS